MAKDRELEMVVAGLVLDPGTNSPIVILKDPESDTCLPVWIGMPEATAIASAVKKVDIARPMTHDLLKDVIEEMGGRVLKVCIRALEQNTFFADIEVIVGDKVSIIDARPSDAIALAVRVDAPISVARAVLEQAQVTLVSVNPEEMGEEVTVDPEQLDSEATNFATIEKEKWEEILADMDPDDFKYKM